MRDDWQPVKDEGLRKEQRPSLEGAPQVGSMSCPNENCPQFGVLGKGNIGVHATTGKNRISLLFCRACNTHFSERLGTILDDCRIVPHKVVSILKHLVEGESQRGIAALLKIDRATVSRYAKLAAGREQELLDELVTMLSDKQKRATHQEVGLHPKDYTNSREYRDCITHQILELFSTLDTISSNAGP